MKLKCPYCMKDTRTDRLIINLCHALRHNVKFFRSSMTLQSISGRETVSHAQQAVLYLCIRTVQTVKAIAGLLSGKNFLQPYLHLTFFFRCHTTINHDLVLNMLKPCKQFVWSWKRMQSYTSALHVKAL